MKILFCALALCGYALAQDVNGVSLTGTPDNPMIVNHSSKPVIGWTVTRFDGDGNELPADRIVLADELMKDNPGIQPGETQTPKIHNEINFSARGSAVRVALDSVLFADGEVAGPDTMAPEFGALDGFAHQLRDIQEDFGRSPRLINVPSAYSKAQQNAVSAVQSLEVHTLSAMAPKDIFPLPCSNTGGCWPIVQYCCDASISGIVYGTPYGIQTPAAGGSALCGPGSPQQGYAIGDQVSATIFCPVSEYFGFSNESSKRNDFQPDRIVQSFSIYDPADNALQNEARLHELCAYAQLPNRGGQGPFGKAVTEYNRSYGCP